MLPARSKLAQVAAVIIVLSFLQAYGPTGAGQVGDAAQGAASQTPQILGRLYTSGNRNILVDKEKANTGTTILDGATLETPDCTTAITYIGQLDVVTLYNEVRLATNTVAVINYGPGRVKVTLKEGCAKLFVKPDTEGTIETPDGKITPASQPDAANRRRAEVCYPDATNSDFDPSCTPLSLIIIPSIGGGGFLAMLAARSISASPGENPSASAPF